MRNDDEVRTQQHGPLEEHHELSGEPAGLIILRREHPARLETVAHGHVLIFADFDLGSILAWFTTVRGIPYQILQ